METMSRDFSLDQKSPFLSGETLVVVDFEYTAWEGSLERGWEKEEENAEIIQIGAVEICSNAGQWEMQREFNQFIRPLLRPDLSDYIIRLTGITQETINDFGVSFPVALKSFYEFSTKYSRLCANGDDWTFLELNCQINDVENPFVMDRFMNVRPYLAKQLGLDEDSPKLHSHRLPQLIESLEGEPHNALVDARSIAKALMHTQALIYM